MAWPPSFTVGVLMLYVYRLEILNGSVKTFFVIFTSILTSVGAKTFVPYQKNVPFLDSM